MATHDKNSLNVPHVEGKEHDLSISRNTSFVVALETDIQGVNEYILGMALGDSSSSQVVTPLRRITYDGSGPLRQEFKAAELSALAGAMVHSFALVYINNEGLIIVHNEKKYEVIG